jgi:flagellin-like hook-associated protein FlgL
MQRMNEVAVKINDGTNAAERKTIATEVDAVIESLVKDANSKYTGRYLFGGVGGTNMSGLEPFAVTRDASGKISGVTYEGSTERREVQISESSSTYYGLVGEGTAMPSANEDIGIFKFTNYEDISAEGDPPNFQNVEVRIFDTLITLRDNLQAEDFTDLESELGRVQASVDHVITKVIDNATSQQKFERIEKNVDALESSQVSRLSDLEDLDMAVAFNNLTLMQTNLQASLQMITRMNAMSIVNYI